MGASKRYKGKDCAYCGEPGSSSTNDHVVAKSFFLDDERTVGLDLPQVPACTRCNNKKSRLENYVGSAVLIASKHPESNRYLREKVVPRLSKNKKLRAELNIGSPPQWVNVNGIFQRLHVLRIDPEKITCLIEMIVRGLYRYHYGKPLPREMGADAYMIQPQGEAAIWASISEYFPPEVPRITCELGRGSFTYTCVQSPALDGFTAWVIALHGNIRLHGDNSSADHWWCITWPTDEALAAAQSA